MSKEKKRCTAIVLAAGNGSRMKSTVAKQFMTLKGKPLIWYALQVVQQSQLMDDCIVVTGAEDIAFVKDQIVDKYGFTKVDCIVAGGKERYESVANALQAIADGKQRIPNRDGYIVTHDGARPFLTEKLLQDTLEAAKAFHACVAAVPSKDTVKLADKDGFATQTPERNRIWNVQTPQVFDAKLIIEAYSQLITQLPQLKEQGTMVTDDAGVVELFTDVKVKLVKSSYQNIKITTPEDLSVAEAFLSEREKVVTDF